MEVSELKDALLSKRPVIVEKALLGEVFQSQITAIIYTANEDKIDVSIETKDAFANSVAVSSPETVRYATSQEISDFCRQRHIIGEILPRINYDADPRITAYRHIKNISLYDMAVFLTNMKDEEVRKRLICSEHCEVFKKDGICLNDNAHCIKATKKFLESEEKI